MKETQAAGQLGPWRLPPRVPHCGGHTEHPVAMIVAGSWGRPLGRPRFSFSYLSAAITPDQTNCVVINGRKAYNLPRLGKKEIAWMFGPLQIAPE